MVAVVITTILLGICTLCLTLLYWKRRKQLGLLEKIGLPGPHVQAHWLLGNILFPKDKYLQISAWTKEYGKTYGFYEGPRPWIVTSDLEILNEMLIKQFSNFTARMEFPIGPHKKSKTVLHMFGAEGLAWKRLRLIINPTFSAYKLKQVNTLLGPRVDTLVNNLSKFSDQQNIVEIHDLYQRFTMDVIADVAFGLNTDSQNNPHNLFLKNGRLVFKEQEDLPTLVKCIALFPEIRNAMFRFFHSSVMSSLLANHHVWLIKQFDQVLQQRKAANVDRHDLLQLMMDAAATTMEDSSSGLQFGSDEKLENVKKTLTDQELVWQSYLFLLAGYETSSNALTYLTYLLALNPDKQEALRLEIDENISSTDDVTYDVIMKLAYLDQCVSETLRMYPVASGVVNRACTTACTIKGIHIPEGTQMLADVWTIHHDPTIYPDPWEFKPERFSPTSRAGHHPLQYLAFGAGPRNCVGMRFGLMEIKRAMVHVIKRFTFEKCDKTEVPLTLKEGGTISPVNGVYVKLVPRF